MSNATAVEAVRVIDTDTHVCEPADLWTSRMPARWHDAVPRAVPHPDTGRRTWRIGDVWLREEAWFAQAGWGEFPTGLPAPPRRRGCRPRRVATGGTGRANGRVRHLRADPLPERHRLLRAAVHAPGTGDRARMRRAPTTTSSPSSRATAPDRLIPIAMLPFWDVDAAVVEMARARRAGSPGILFANKYEKVGLPPCWDAHWDPVYAAAQDIEHSRSTSTSRSARTTGAWWPSAGRARSTPPRARR